MNTAAAQFNKEEHLQPLQPDRLHREEINRGHTSPVNGSIQSDFVWQDAGQTRAVKNTGTTFIEFVEFELK